GTAHWANLGIAVESTTAVEIVAHEAAATGADTRLEVDWALEAAVALLPDPVVATATPAFSSSTLPNLGATIGYWFRIATNPDAASGALINSGWLTTPTWRPPVGALAEGPTYYWSVVVTDGVQTHASAPRPLRIDRRLGIRPGGAADTLGPLSVNLATGALSFGLSTRAIPSPSGPLAASLTYNSSAAAPHGLTGRYWSGCDPSGTALSPPGPAGAGFVRTDATIDFSWTSSEPAGPGLGPGRCIVWTGYLSLPPSPSGSWRMEADHSDRVRVKVGGGTVIDNWADGPVRTTVSTSAIPAGTSGSANTPLPVIIEHYDATGDDRVALRVVSGDPAATGESLGLSPSWLSGGPAAVLPQGWSLAAGPHGGPPWVGAIIGTAEIILIAPDAGRRRFRRSGPSSAVSASAEWLAPSGSETALAWIEDPGGQGSPGAGAMGAGAMGAGELWAIETDGTTTRFDGGGRVLGVRGPTDAGLGTSPSYEADATGRISALVDSVSGRRLTLSYGPNCPVPAGFDPAPLGMLCSVGLPDAGGVEAQTMTLAYAGGLLVRVQNSSSATLAAETTDMSYSPAIPDDPTTMVLVGLRDPLAFDATAAHPALVSDPARATWRVTYSAGGDKVTRITSPSPNPTGAPATPLVHDYAYVSVSPAIPLANVASTQVKIPGITTSTLARQV
ncbi:MAG: PA14 domain-containing protein, partial [Acidimicrobiales bacterium]